MILWQSLEKLKTNVTAQILRVFTKKIVKIPDYHDVSKEFLNIRIENLLKKGTVRNKPNRGNPLFTLNDVTTEIPIHDESYSVSHLVTPSK